MSEVEMLDFEAFKERYEKVPVEEYPNNVREAVPDPVVSVHLLTYNHVDYIREAIESVLMQEVDFPMEIVLGDDDSSDGTREICIEYAEKYPDLIRLQLHHRENNIHLHGRPTHLFQYWYNTFSTWGDYIAILSGDDYWTDPLKLQKQCDFLKSNSGYALSFHDSAIVDSDKNIIQGSAIPDKNKCNLSNEKITEGVYIPAVGLVVKNVFKEIPSCVLECISEDRFSRVIVGHHGKGKYHPNIRPSAYRIHEEGIYSGLHDLEKYKEVLNSSEKIQKYLEKEKSKYVYCHEKRLSSDMKRGFYISVKESCWLDAIFYFAKIFKFDVERKNYAKAFVFICNSIRYLTGNMRQRLI